MAGPTKRGSIWSDGMDDSNVIASIECANNKTTCLKRNHAQTRWIRWTRQHSDAVPRVNLFCAKRIQWCESPVPLRFQASQVEARAHVFCSEQNRVNEADRDSVSKGLTKTKTSLNFHTGIVAIRMQIRSASLASAMTFRTRSKRNHWLLLTKTWVHASVVGLRTHGTLTTRSQGTTDLAWVVWFWEKADFVVSRRRLPGANCPKQRRSATKDPVFG